MTYKKFKFVLALLVSSCWLLAGCQPAAESGAPEDGAAAYYKGKNVRWIVPYSPGGGYDEYARLIAPYLAKYTGARIDIINRPGAGGMRGANELFNAPKNGLTIGMINGSALVTNEIAGFKGADYRIAEFEYIGRIVADVRVFAVSRDSGYETIQDIWDAKDTVRIGATGLGGSTYVDAVITNEAFDTGLTVIHGFDSSSVIRQAMLRGNIVGTWGSWGSAVDAVDTGQQRILLQSGEERQPDLMDVPTAFELAGKAEDAARAGEILSAWEMLLSVGRPVAAPPGTPADRLAFLREAFAAAMQDPEMLEIASRTSRPLNYANGEEMRGIVTGTLAMPDHIKTLFVRAVKGEL